MVDMEIVNLIANVGFPIVAFFLMYNMSTKTIKENTTAIQELINEIKRRNP